MNPGEHEVMAAVEERLWWYQGLRDVLARTLLSPGAAIPQRPRVLDAGCGTGRNLVALRDWLQPAYLGGFDASADALRFAREKAPEADLYTADICDPSLREADLDLVISLDVICIPGTALCFPGLERIVDALRPGGLLVLNLPAYEWIRSEHDVAVHTSERYTAGRVRTLLTDLGLEVHLVTYRLCLLFPLVVASRLPTLLGQLPGQDEARSDLHSLPGEMTNRALLAAVRAENALIARGFRFPFGSSVYAIGRKR